MPWTPNLDLPYPAGATAPNVPYDLQALAEAIDARMAAVPYREAAGKASVSALSATAVSLVVTFPTSRFTQAPIVTVAQEVASPQLNSISVTSVSTTQFTVVVYRTSGNATVPVHWHAVQMTESAAAG